MPDAPPRPPLRRLVAAVVLSVLFVALGLVLLHDGRDRGERPSGASLRLVPGDALIVVQVSADQTRPEVDDALRQLDDLPGGTALLARIRERLVPDGCPAAAVDAREATVAILRTTAGRVSPLVLVEHGGRRADAGRIIRCGGQTAQRLGRFVAIGSSGVVREARRLFGVPGARGSLAASGPFRTLVGGLPGDRVLTAWLAPDGVRQVLAAQGVGGALLARLLDRPDLGGTAIGLESRDDGFRLVVRRRASAAPGPAFAATSSVAAPQSALATFLTNDPLDAASEILDLAAVARGEQPQSVGALLSALVERLDRARGGTVRRDVVEAARSPSEVVVAPGPTGRGLAVTAIVPVTDGPRATRALRRLRGGLARALGRDGTAAGNGSRAIAFREAEVAGRRAWILRVPGGVGGGYLVDGDRVLFFTSQTAAAAILTPGPRLPDRVRWDRGGSDRRNLAMSIGFLDFSELLRTAAPTTTGARTLDPALAAGLARVQSVAVRSRTEGRETTFDVDLRIP